ncbi:secretin N-terminal domain-containing protein, partial [Helicobacter sp. 12S02634-8]|uniref:secretin N-terminal domain-containing protein n=1 Tax=Helicobacter sp. 12S02634-8 TaxID=1476199 RepID=UPI0015519205
MKRVALLVCLCLWCGGKDLCGDKTFDISIHQDTSAQEVIEALANECFFSVIYADKPTQEILHSQKLILNLKSHTLKPILQIIADEADLDYEIKDNHLKFNRLLTQTFNIDYIATARVGSSNTDVIFSQDTQNNLYQRDLYNTPLGTNNAQQKAMLLGSEQTRLHIGRSGTKIYSIDEPNFWGELENELYAITYRPGDKNQPDKLPFKPIVINKGAGLITITASPSQIKR